jgi:hypothetical protein
VLEALVHRQDDQLAGPAEAAVVEDAAQVPEHPRGLAGVVGEDAFNGFGHLSLQAKSDRGFSWRRRRDSNPRNFRSAVFKTAALGRSATPPGPREAQWEGS